MDSKIIMVKKVNNSTTITFHDVSRKLTGDRWHVEIQCTVSVSGFEDTWKNLSESDPSLLECIREKVGSELTYSISRTRNFADEKEKQTLSLEIVKQIEDNSIRYLKKESFKNRLFEKRYQEARIACLAEKNMAKPPPVDEDDEPDDFSHLFK